MSQFLVEMAWAHLKTAHKRHKLLLYNDIIFRVSKIADIIPLSSKNFHIYPSFFIDIQQPHHSRMLLSDSSEKMLYKYSVTLHSVKIKLKFTIGAPFKSCNLYKEIHLRIKPIAQKLGLYRQLNSKN